MFDLNYTATLVAGQIGFSLIEVNSFSQIHSKVSIQNLKKIALTCLVEALKGLLEKRSNFENPDWNYINI